MSDAAPTPLILTFACPNRPGIVFEATRFLYEHGGDITEAQQFDDQLNNRFFARFAFNIAAPDLAALAAAFAPVAAGLACTHWRLRPAHQRPRVLILASRADHCLADLLYRWRTATLPMDIVGIAANHPAETFKHLDLSGVPFHHLPVTPETRPAQEAALLRLVAETRADWTVLARYMQILSADTARALEGRAVNIHHSFLPSFKGTRPYHQAHARGVKLIGATAHFVTEDLDEGPIIEQHAERVSHRDTPEALALRGRDIERRTLADALALLLEDRVLLNGRTTVVFRP